MSPSSSQPRMYGFVPRFMAASTDQHVRVSDAERAEVADRLAAHFSNGRLDQAEFDQRLDQAMTAKTRGDLAGLFHDLPEATRPGGHHGAKNTRRSEIPARRDGRSHPLLVLAFIIAMFAIAGQVAAHVFNSWLLGGFSGLWVWTSLLIVIVVISGRARNRSR